jgi:very-short-patch-repair endonuclease
MHVKHALGLCSDLAGRQKGVVHHRQLIAAGLDRGAIRRLIEGGFLHPLHRAVYAVGHRALPPFAMEQAAILACGDGSLVSHRSALYLWGLLNPAPKVVDITVHRRCRAKDAIRLHHGPVHPRHVRTRHGLPVTSPALSLIDFAAQATVDELDDAVAEARAHRLIREGELEKTVEQASQRRGAARMRAFLTAEGEPGITRSRAERRFRRLLREAGLPQPKTNVRLACGVTPDFLWEAERVVVEVDSWKFHGHRRAFEGDRKKSIILTDAGYLVIRITWKQFTKETLWLIAHLARALDRRARLAG